MRRVVGVLAAFAVVGALGCGNNNRRFGSSATLGTGYYTNAMGAPALRPPPPPPGAYGGAGGAGMPGAVGAEQCPGLDELSQKLDDLKKAVDDLEKKSGSEKK